MHTTWANDPVNSPNHYTRSHPGMECIELTADTSFCLGNAIKYLWRYHSKGRPVEDLEKARWYLCHVIDHDEKIAWTRQQHAILDTLANDPAIPDAEAHTWAKLRQGFPYSALACLDRLIEHERRPSMTSIITNEIEERYPYPDNGERPTGITRLGQCLASRKAYRAGVCRKITDREIDMAALAVYTGTSGMGFEEVEPLWSELNPDVKERYRFLARLAIVAARTEALK